jgi:transcription elongation factor GreA-like protein/transcription elongation GreA/GreB family factor
MSYLEDFQTQINNRDFHKFFQLWEEYCTSDNVDAKEFIQLLKMIKNSDFARLFGQFVETALPLWQCVHTEHESYQILKLLIDLETTQTPLLADTAYQALEKKYSNDPKFKDRIRQIGLRNREAFQGAISNYDLLMHLEKGNYVYHTGGWGAGEVIDVSSIREQAAIEFENVTGIKHFTFDNAFKTLIPLENDHFLARRFADADKLEQEARKDPVGIVKTLLRNLGPKTAAEVKEELCVLVIPEKDWSKWWQTTRTKLKKDTMVDSPDSLREPFRLRETEISHADELHRAIEDESNVNFIIQTAYSFARDLPNTFRKKEVKDPLKDKLLNILNDQDLTQEQELQIILFLESMFGHQVEGNKVQDFIQSIERIDKIINEFEIVAFKKKALMMVREYRDDWANIFAGIFFTIQPNSLRDYILKELDQQETKHLLNSNLKELVAHPENNPEVFVWYFQKVAKKNPGDIPYGDKEGHCKFLEGFLILLHKIEHESEYRDLTKKMYTLLTAKRFAIVRIMIEGTSEEFIKEFLLLVSKCHVFSDHEKKIMRSLAHVVHPSLAPVKKKKRPQDDPNILWTTQQGYLKTQERIKQIATVEMIENAKEVEAARALGDLRENSEYKFACERRSRLQGEMKNLSKLLSKARVITIEDVFPDEVGIGSIVEIENPKGDKVTYTILGPWEADADANVISYQSQLAQSMAGFKLGDIFKFRDEEYKILGIKSFLD